MPAGYFKYEPSTFSGSYGYGIDYSLLMPSSTGIYSTEIYPKVADSTPHENVEPTSVDKKSVAAPANRPIAEILHEGISRAFDEGFDSPYDLKDGIVKEIAEQINENIKSKNQKKTSGIVRPPDCNTIIDHLQSYLPKNILKPLTDGGRIFLAGGSIVRLLRCGSAMPEGWTKTDWDIYIHEDDLPHNCINSQIPIQKEGFAELIEDYKGSSNLISKVYCKSGDMFSLPLNVIAGKYDHISDVLKTFDFQFLQTGIYFADGKLQYFVLNDNAWNDLVLGIIRFTPEYLKTIPNKKVSGVLNRIKKYVKRGFQDHTGKIHHPILSQFLNLN